MKTLRPEAPLDRYVELIWLTSGNAAEGGVELALPTGTVELVVSLDGDAVSVFSCDDLTVPVSLAGPVVCGVHTKPFGIPAGGGGRSLGVHFKPGGAAALLDLPIHELENVHVSLQDLIGARSRQLTDRLSTIVDDTALLCAMEAILAGWLHSDMHPAVGFALRMVQDSRIPPDVRALVSASGYSHRRFNELFRATVGLSAKRYTSIARLQRTIDLVCAAGKVDWSDVALRCGYYDQAHLIHEFRRYTRLTPSRYLAQGTDRPNHPRMN